MQEPRPIAFKDFEFKDRMFCSIIDLVVLAIFLGISPPVRDSMNGYHLRGDKKDPVHYKKFLQQVCLYSYNYLNADSNCRDEKIS
jgi:hypothetical protein